MKKLICILCLALVVSMSGCNKDKNEDKTDKTDKVSIVENDVYTTPKAPTKVQIELYNALSEALEEEEEEEIAKLVAQNFVADFYTFKNKTGSEDVGGLTYIPENRREEFLSFASLYAYSNYESIVQEYGNKHLPQIKTVEVTGQVETEVEYTEIIPASPENDNKEQMVTDTYDAYVVSVDVAFEKTKVDTLPASLKVTVIEMDDEFRVIAVE